MSDNIPFEMQVEIMKRLPVKSLIQFRSVSKPWKSLIDSSQFIARYNIQHTQTNHLLVTYTDVVAQEQKYVSVVDDHTFPQQKVSMTVPLFAKILMCCSIIGSSLGLFCFYGLYPKGPGSLDSKTKMAIIWNPSIRKEVSIVVPNVPDDEIYDTDLAFGVCRETTDPKIVKITQINSDNDMESIICIPWQVEVFTLSIGAWRSPYSTNLPCKSIRFDWQPVFVDECLYWLAIDRITMDGEFRNDNLIISFHMTSEEFGELNLPDNLAHQPRYYMSMSKLKESLVVFEWMMETNIHVVVWMMENGATKSCTKLLTVDVYGNTPDSFTVKWFRNSGEPTIELKEDDLAIYKLVVCEPYTKLMDNIGIDARESSASVCPYVETILLLDQPNFPIYKETGILEFPNGLVS